MFAVHGRGGAKAGLWGSCDLEKVSVETSSEGALIQIKCVDLSAY